MNNIWGMNCKPWPRILVFLLILYRLLALYGLDKNVLRPPDMGSPSPLSSNQWIWMNLDDYMFLSVCLYFFLLLFLLITLVSSPAHSKTQKPSHFSSFKVIHELPPPYQYPVPQITHAHIHFENRGQVWMRESILGEFSMSQRHLALKFSSSAPT